MASRVTNYPLTDFLGGRLQLGQSGEAAAVEHLKRAGYQILERNLRTRYGELDIIARDGQCLVFVEVRTRRSRSMVPEESITTAKKQRLARLGMRYLQDHAQEDADWRIDVIAIEEDASGRRLGLHHLVSAVEES
jgi:putative endonuclease